MYYEAKALAHQLDPKWDCHTPKNDTLINLFQISGAEQAQLKTIISYGMALSRH